MYIVLFTLFIIFIFYISFFFFFFFNDTSTTEIYTLSLHDALPIYLFFVLSGFLIAGILLDNRSSPRYFRTFYIRRACRIVPAYALLLLAFYAFAATRSEEHTSELQSRRDLVCRLLLEKKKTKI